MKSNNYVRIAFVAFSGLAFWACSGGGDDNTDGGDDASVDVSVDHQQDSTTPPDAGPDVTSDVNVQDVTLDVNGDSSDAADEDALLDAGADADAALPPEGTPCTPPNTIQNESCGFCGTHYRACLADGDGGYAWGSWGFCQGEVQGGCDPNATYGTTACGNCGTMKQVCLSNCTFDLTQTCTEPTNACRPLSSEFELGLSCDGGGRERTCDNQCQFGNFGSCQTMPTLDVPSTVGAISSIVQSFDGNNKIGRMTTGSCPSTVSTTITVYGYTVVQNNTTYTATVDIYHSTAPNASYIDSVMTVYPGSTPPDNGDAGARGKCSVYVDDSCTDTTNTNPPSCYSNWAGLMKKDSRSVTIAPGATIVVYSAAYFSTQGSGDFQVNVKTQSLL
jgi:hypothetical protein